MDMKHTIYTSGLGYWLNLVILNGLVLMSDLAEKLRLIINVLQNQNFRV